MSLDSTLYSVVDNGTPNGKPRRYVKVVSSTHHKRISLPLSGISRVSGNIRVVLRYAAKLCTDHFKSVFGPSLGSVANRLTNRV